MAFEDFITSNQEDRGDSEFIQLIKQLMTDKNIDTKTELSDKEIKEIAKLLFISKFIKNKKLTNYILSFMRLRISFLRKGRKEFIYSIKPTETPFPVQQEIIYPEEKRRSFNFLGRGNK
jgi:hypothetical protein